VLQGKRQVKEFFDPSGKDDAKKLDAKLGFDSPQAEVSVWVGGLEKKDEKKDKKEEKKAEAKDKDKSAKKDEKKGEEKKGQEKAKAPGVEPKGEPAVKLTFGKRENDLVYVKRRTADGTETRVAVPVTILQKAAPSEGPLAYLDRDLSPFTTDEVTK